MKTSSLASLFGSALVALSLASAHAETQRPNIILVMPDDTSYGNYACLGNPISRTPSVDAFKKQSLLFTQFHTSPTCSPTRAGLMSGRHEFKNGVTHTIGGRERLALGTFTLPQMLKTAGYATGIFGKWHLGDEQAYRPESRGFDEVYIHGGGGIGTSGDAPGNNHINPTLWHNGRFEKTTGYCTDLFFAQAIRWMDGKREAKQPFFAYIPLNAAHAPHIVPKEYYQQYLGKPGVSEGEAKFFGMVENIDTNFGTMLAKLKEWGIEHDTMVIFIGTDNGNTGGRKVFDSGMRGNKATPYQGGTRGPCFVRWPAGNVPADTECNALTAHIDIYPTIAEIAGATLPPEAKQQVEGRSLLSLLRNPKAEWADRTLVQHVGRWKTGKANESEYAQCSIQNSRFTLVNNEELYDLKADPGEATNVISMYPEVVAELRATYKQWWTDVQPLLVNEDIGTFDNLTFRDLYTKQFGAKATAEAKKNKQLEDADADSDNNSRAKLQKLREERKKRMEGTPKPANQ